MTEMPVSHCAFADVCSLLTSSLSVSVTITACVVYTSYTLILITLICTCTILLVHKTRHRQSCNKQNTSDKAVAIRHTTSSTHSQRHWAKPKALFFFNYDIQRV